MGQCCCKQKEVSEAEMQPLATSKNFELDCLTAHNRFRAKHGCPPMNLNSELCNFATEWAQHLAKQRCMMHREGNQYGENIFHAINHDPSGEAVVQAWYNEIQDYNFRKPGFSGKTGHFTQVVWMESTQLGVGRAQVENVVYVVCNYNPAGNVANEFKANVPPVKK